MILLDLREPVSAWTHGFGFVMALPGLLLLFQRSRADRALRWTLMIYGASLATCYAASAAYHGLRLVDRQVALLATIDRLGIFALIAGTYTPIAWGLLRGRWRAGVLSLIWGATLVGMTAQVACEALPAWLSTGLYLAMGWGAIFCYGEMGRAVSRRAVRPVLTGGLLYSVGATINLLHWPAPWPGTFGDHELFHVFVLAASLVHFRFILRVVIPFSLSEAAIRPRTRPILAPRPHLALFRRGSGRIAGPR